MSATLGRRLALGWFGGLITLATASAGPYFNVDRAGVRDLSRDAVTWLNLGRIEVIEMFTSLDAGQIDKATKQKDIALNELKNAIGGFEKISKLVGDHTLIINPRSGEEREIVSEFRAALEAKHIPFPRTERDLALIAVTIVESYEKSVDEVDLTKFPKQWQGVRRIILSETVLLNVGNLASIVWAISGSS